MLAALSAIFPAHLSVCSKAFFTTANAAAAFRFRAGRSTVSRRMQAHLVDADNCCTSMVCWTRRAMLEFVRFYLDVLAFAVFVAHHDVVFSTSSWSEAVTF